MASKKIQFVYPANGVAERAIHLEHHRGLLQTFLEALRPQGGSQLSELGQPFEQWAIDELMKFGVVSLYHQWERQAKSLLLEQLGQLPKQDKRNGSSDNVTWFLRALEDELNAQTNDRARAALHECRLLANAIKHDTGAKYEQLALSHPAYFLPGPEPAMERFRVTPELLDRLFDELFEFWENLPHDPGHAAAHRRSSASPG